MTINTRVKQYFDGNPRKDTLFFTEDYCGFYSEEDARGHGDALKKKGISEKVTPVTREELNKWIAEQPTADGSVKMMEHEVTQEDLDNNPELTAQGISVGDVIQIPVDDTQNTAEEIAADVKVAVTKKTVKKGKTASKKK